MCPKTNKLLQECIYSCFKEFLSYYDLIKEQFENLNSFLKNFPDPEIKELIFNNENLSNIIFENNFSKTEWYICKQAPVANNLRFFLTIITSSKDLERCGDYVYSITKLLMDNKSQLSNDNLMDIQKIWSFLLEQIYKIWDIFINNIRLFTQEKLDEIQSIKEAFSIEFKEFFKKQLNTNVSFIFIISVKIDRTMDHLFNIIESFYTINKHLIIQ